MPSTTATSDSRQPGSSLYGINGMRLTLTNDRAHELVVDVASGAPNEVPQIASVLEVSTERR